VLDWRFRSLPKAQPCSKALLRALGRVVGAAPLVALAAMVVALLLPASRLDAQAATLLHRPAAIGASATSLDPAAESAATGDVATSALPTDQMAAEAPAPGAEPTSAAADSMTGGFGDESSALGADASATPEGLDDVAATLGAGDGLTEESAMLGARDGRVEESAMLGTGDERIEENATLGAGGEAIVASTVLGAGDEDIVDSAVLGAGDGHIEEGDMLGLGEPAAPLSEAPLLIDQVQTYYVAPGDSLTAIARRFGIDVDTLRAANAVADANLLFVGQALVVLPVPGVLEKATPGDSVAALAQRYGVPAAAIDAANGLDDATSLKAGQRVLVPGGKPLPLPLARSAIWPPAGTGGQHQAQFIAAAVPAAQASQRETGVPAAVTIAQAILESDWGDSVLARAANNFFGIKASGTAAGSGVYWLPSREVVDDEDVVSVEPFRTYTSPEASFADHGLFFRQNPRYWPALALASEPAAFAQAIADAGYATDPAYGAKLIALMNTYQLYQYDVA
jgi:LysM repeat protein